MKELAEAEEKQRDPQQRQQEQRKKEEEKRPLKTLEQTAGKQES